jgi:DNA polymerase-3 subunit alpha (Gram-positive type)
MKHVKLHTHTKISAITKGAELPVNGEFIVVSIDTTGLSPSNNKIIEIGAVKLRNMEITEEFNTFINPQMPIPEEVVRQIGITDEMVKDAPLEEDAFREFIKFCGNCKYLIAHNAAFDANFIRAGLERCGLDYNFVELDTVKLCRAITPDEKTHRLGNMIRHFKIKDNRLERAGDYAKATALLFITVITEASKIKPILKIGDLKIADKIIEVRIVDNNEN